MHWGPPTVSTLWQIVALVQLSALVLAAWSDLTSRIIPDRVCLALGIAGAAMRLMVGPLALATSAAFALTVFLLLALLHARSMLGGGDVKLLTAAIVGQSVPGAIGLMAMAALAGGVLGLLHLALRRLPSPARAPAGSFSLRRVYAAERWRIVRRAPLPYAVAIACGGVWAVLTNPGS